jgi:hypothetical protein
MQSTYRAYLIFGKKISTGQYIFLYDLDVLLTYQFPLGVPRYNHL